LSNLSNLIFKNEKHYITQNFSNTHKATDYGTYRKKIPQYAIMDGYVSWVGTLSGGNAVKIIYPSINKEFLHLHLDKVSVSKNDKVNHNTMIGTTGMTGNATGIHLHLAIRDLTTNDYIDPEVYGKSFVVNDGNNTSANNDNNNNNDNDKETENAIYYTVVKGDNLTKIAKKYNTKWRKIYEDNKSIIGNNPNLIYPGQKLIIK